MLNKMHDGDKVPSGERMATLAISDAAEMSMVSRVRIARWLKAQADMLVREGDDYAPDFRGHYLRAADGEA